MADDPRVPPYVLDTIMCDPTAQRLVHLTGMTVQDVRTDLSALIADAIELHTAFCDSR